MRIEKSNFITGELVLPPYTIQAWWKALVTIFHVQSAKLRSWSGRKVRMLKGWLSNRQNACQQARSEDSLAFKTSIHSRWTWGRVRCKSGLSIHTGRFCLLSILWSFVSLQSLRLDSSSIDCFQPHLMSLFCAVSIQTSVIM